MTTATQTIPIPQPPPRMIVGNLPEVRRKPSMFESLLDVAREYGELFQLDIPTGRLIVASGPELVHELCDETRFDKGMGPGLVLIRKRLGDGLFTAYTHEINWQKAHNILMPTFSQQAMKAYVPAMVDIAEQLMGSLEKTVGRGEIDVCDDMTRLTLDTIGLCGFSFRFDSFSRGEPHPFVVAMNEQLAESQAMAARPQALNKFMFGAKRRLAQASQVMETTVGHIIEERRQSGRTEVDLLQHMLTGIDKKTGEGLPDTNIISQCLTFLVAGHETTSGLLSFAINYLVKHPEILARCQAEVDRVFGPDRNHQPNYEQITALHYIEQVLKETLRIWPTAPAFTRSPRQDTLLAGKYALTKGQNIMVLIPALHRQPSIYPNPDRFDPERFAPEAEAKRGPDTFLPFGTGARACIGRQFAMQEAKLVLGMLVHRFDLLDHRNYQLKIKQSLTIKPAGFFIKVEPRTPARSGSAAPVAVQTQAPVETVTAAPTGVSLAILYGSNLGCGEGLANDLAAEAGQRGFTATATPLDDAVNGLPTEGAAVIICSSYNGAPPDNAVEFTHWVQDAAVDLKGVRYAVFGCGNREWATTFQAVPRQLDARLAERGARRLLDRGEGDAGRDLDGEFREWKGQLWSALAQEFKLAAPTQAVTGARFAVEVLEDSNPNPFAEAFEAAPMVIVDNRELQQHGSGRSTRHLELALPDNFAYRAGDHLGIIPENSAQLVERVAACFGLTPETRIRIHQQSPGKTVLPLESVLSVRSVLTHYVELQETASRYHLETLARYCSLESEKAQVLALAQEPAYSQLRAQNRSLVDVMEQFPSARLPFGHYLELVSPLRPRYYSISSSPTVSGRLVSLTVGVVDSPARKGAGRYRGTASNYLAGQARGQSVHAFLPDTHGQFALPADPLTPIIMVGAGTGLAPYRGFLQERAAAKQRGKALLFFGCRHPGQDYLYQSELEGWERDGVVQLVTAFSRHETTAKAYVQDRLREHADEVWEMLQAGAVVYVCGDAAGMAGGVQTALNEILTRHGQSADSLADRLRLDVWASS